jgi:hypothetical protein
MSSACQIPGAQPTWPCTRSHTSKGAQVGCSASHCARAWWAEPDQMHIHFGIWGLQRDNFLTKRAYHAPGYRALVPKARGKSEQARRVYPGRPEHPQLSYNALCGWYRMRPVCSQNVDTAYENICLCRHTQWA